MRRSRRQINNGFTGLSYTFGFSDAEDERVGAVLNEACHVFHMHAGGTWAEL